MNKDKTIEQYVQEALANSKEEIVKNGIDGVKGEVQKQIQWRLGSHIETAAKNLFEDEDVKKSLAVGTEKIKVYLIENFAEELQKVLPSIAAAFAKKLQEKAIKNLTEDSYQMRDVYKKIFE